MHLDKAIYLTVLVTVLTVTVHGDSRLFVIWRSTLSGNLFSVASIPSDPSETFQFGSSAPLALQISPAGMISKSSSYPWSSMTDTSAFTFTVYRNSSPTSK